MLTAGHAFFECFFGSHIFLCTMVSLNTCRPGMSATLPHLPIVQNSTYCCQVMRYMGGMLLLIPIRFWPTAVRHASGPQIATACLLYSNPTFTVGRRSGSHVNLIFNHTFQCETDIERGNRVSGKVMHFCPLHKSIRTLEH